MCLTLATWTERVGLVALPEARGDLHHHQSQNASASDGTRCIQCLPDRLVMYLAKSSPNTDNATSRSGFKFLTYSQGE